MIIIYYAFLLFELSPMTEKIANLLSSDPRREWPRLDESEMANSILHFLLTNRQWKWKLHGQRSAFMSSTNASA